MQQAKILILDDSSPTRLWLSKKLSDSYVCSLHSSCRSAYQKLQEELFDLILVEQLLPDFSGLEFIQQLKSEDKYSKTPVIMVTREEDPSLILEAFRVGCTDFMRKPLEFHELDARIKNALEGRARLQEQQRSFSELKQRAERDPLTGLLNRQTLFEFSSKEISKAQRVGHSLSLLLIDIDDFKTINDTFGHIAGDQLLKEFASVLSGSTREYDIVGRYGGDEFVILLPSTNHQQAARVAEKIIQAVNQKEFAFRGQQMTTSPSIGVATYDHLPEKHNYSGRTGLTAMIECADNALYEAKKSGKNQLALGRYTSHA